MVSERRSRVADSSHVRNLLAALLFASAPVHTGWEAEVQAQSAGDFPDSPSFNAEYRLGWSEIELTTSIVGALGELWSLSDSTRQGKSPAKWRRVKVVPARDLFAGMFFIRSQRLLAGDEVAVVIYPGGAPFLARVKSLGTEAIVIAGQKRDAIKLDLTIQCVNVKKGNILEPHDKFQSGKIWVSNDSDRIPLRAEVNIFVGYVFGELVSFDKQ